MRRWKEHEEGKGNLNRFLFRESKKFFESEYEVSSTIENSVIREMEGWVGVKRSIENLCL